MNQRHLCCQSHNETMQIFVQRSCEMITALDVSSETTATDILAHVKVSWLSFACCLHGNMHALHL
jgi:hypothetical protein